MPTYYSIITNNGLIKHADAANNAVNLNLTQMAVGDSNGVYYDPDGTEIALQNELHRTNLTHVVIDENNPNQLIVEAVLEEVVGPFYIREVGIFDSNGDLFAIGKYPETFKPDLPAGSGKRLYIRMILGFASSPNVNLIINNDIALDPNFSTDVNNKLDYLESKSAKNYVINGNFDIWQRSQNAVGVSGYGYFAPDRFAFDTAGATANISKQEFAHGQNEVPNNPRNFLRYELTAPGSPNSILYHKIEDVRALSGQTCTLSFYAKASSPITLTTDFQQVFGSGGSALVDGNADKVDHNIGTSWQKFTATFNFYSVAGKTIGSANFLQMRWYFPNASNVTIDFAQIQLEKGNVANDFENRSPSEEVFLCQRYYEKSYDLDTPPATITTNGYISERAVGSDIDVNVPFKNTKRTIPTVTIINPHTGTSAYARNYSNSTNVPMGAFYVGELSFNTAKGGLSNGQKVAWHFIADAEL